MKVGPTAAAAAAAAAAWYWILLAFSVGECDAFLPTKNINLSLQSTTTSTTFKPFVSSSSTSSLLRQSESNDSDNEDNQEAPSEATGSNGELVVVPKQTQATAAAAEPIRTLGGGADMIFEMARQMLLWDETEDALQFQQQPKQPSLAKSPTANTNSNAKTRKATTVLPRWHPIRGVSDANPSFRTAAPMMNSQGYAGTIWRNVRKANKPSLWRHALRTYDRMGQKPAKTAASSGAPTSGVGSDTTNDNTLKVPRTNVHHEGALVACAKLGLWQKALQIYRDVEEQQERPTSYQKVFISDNMVLSLIRSCVLASRRTPSASETTTIRRASLDTCLEVLLEMEDKHGLPLVSRHLNPLAAAYQNLGLTQEASRLLQTHLSDRTSGPEEEDGDDPFNVNDVRAKDKGSYSLLVKGAVSEGNWEGAVEALKTMTDAGLYPNARNLNGWTEVSERKTKQRATRSWKKKRDEYWLESVR